MKKNTPETLETIKRIQFDNPQRQAVQEMVAQAVERNPEAFITAFKAMPISLGGRFISADTFKETFPEYRESNDSRNIYNAAVHNAAAVLASEQFRRVLSEPRNPGENRVTLLTGIPGAGKTSMYLAEGKLPKGIHAVYEGQLADPNVALQKVEQVLEAGFKPRIIVAHALPEKALDNTFNRFNTVGRGASINIMAKILGNLSEGLTAVRKKYPETVELTVFDRREFTQPIIHQGWQALDILRSEGTHEQIRERLSRHLESKKHELTDDAYRQALGAAPLIRDGRDQRLAKVHSSVINERSISQGNREEASVDKVSLKPSSVEGEPAFREPPFVARRIDFGSTISKHHDITLNRSFPDTILENLSRINMLLAGKEKISNLSPLIDSLGDIRMSLQKITNQIQENRLTQAESLSAHSSINTIKQFFNANHFDSLRNSDITATVDEIQRLVKPIKTISENEFATKNEQKTTKSPSL